MMMTKEKKVSDRVCMEQPCEDDSIDAADYKKTFVTAVQQARESIKRGEFYTLEEIQKEMPSWIIW